jgi:hypothetical protein
VVTGVCGACACKVNAATAAIAMVAVRVRMAVLPGAELQTFCPFDKLDRDDPLYATRSSRYSRIGAQGTFLGWCVIAIVSGAIIADSLLGPIFAGTSVGADGNSRFYIGIGRIFR